ncbi:MAG: 16S rRNA (adenine(1518)-N(6)/adenine(1519)-N(6))-dimethyltransferase RsmA [Candidatus Sericytochromatia bacterium]
MKTKFFNNVPVRKRFGQNFLTDKIIIDEIIEKSNFTKDDFVLEIGPGHGVLTEKLVERVGFLNAVEIDRDLVKELTDKFKEKNNIKINSGDILEYDLNSIDFSNYDIKNRKAIGNIPYYITTPIIMKIINEESLKIHGVSKTQRFFSELVIMIQKEVGERIVAQEGSKEFGALSVICQYACEVEKLVDVGKRAFYPSPKVDSVVIKLKMKEKDEYDIKEPKIFWRIIKGVFTSRRKTLKNSLKIASFSDELIEKISNDFDLSIRGETMNLNQFSYLSNLIYEKNIL